MMPLLTRKGGWSCRQGARTGRLATQWSVEDEEAAAREWCRRDREQQLRAEDEDEGSPSPEQSEQEKLLSPQPSEAPELDEDEGFGDWSQKPEQRRWQHWGAGETPDAGDPPGGESPEGPQEDDRPHQRTSGSQGGDERSPAEVCLEKLHLSPDSEPQEGLAAEASEPSGPEEPVQGSPGLAETKEHQSCRQPRTPSPLALEGTDAGSPPLSPSTKLSDRTESLNRSIKKSNSVKKSQPALPISRIDARLEQYSQAVETAGRTPKLTRQLSIELPSMAVASTKSRWETGEVQAQSAIKSAPCKDIVAGDMSRRDLWEQKGGPKASSTVKPSQEQGTGQQHILPPSLHAQGRTRPDLPPCPLNPTLPKKLLLMPALAPQPWQLLLWGPPTWHSLPPTVPGGEELWLLVGEGTLSREAASSQGRRRWCWERPRARVSRSRATTPTPPALPPAPCWQPLRPVQ
ncbi:lymphocyte-specific protein 1 isoform X2 [Moschus berezovskii]|uniref:lymphocyte-specific protein 1 isoform X2 n=1 Tax=Moschus berezovskii TaxID=68408 RepID=UPI002443B7C3|nr:lymphocyte-specific protein 1 isoform X2 [Moschus berezovskii]